MENFVWERLAKLHSSPLTLLCKYTNYGYDSGRNIAPLLEKQIKKLRNKLKTYSHKEKNLYDLLASDSVTKDYVLDTINKLKQSQSEDELQLKQLLALRKETNIAKRITTKLSEFSESMKDVYTQKDEHSVQENRQVLESLNVKIEASPGNYRFNCTIDTELTSDIDDRVETAFSQEVELLEKLHPEITFGDLIDHAKQTPNDTLIGQLSNQIKAKKNLVTIAQT